MDFCKTPCIKKPGCSLPALGNSLNFTLLHHTENWLKPQSFKDSTEICFCLVHFSFSNNKVYKRENKILNSSHYTVGLAHSEKTQESPQTLENHQVTLPWDSGVVRALLPHRVLPCMRQDGHSRPGVTSPAPSVAFTAPTLSVLPGSPAAAPTQSRAVWDPSSALSSLLAPGTISLCRARSTRLHEKPLPETWREISKRVMLMRVPSWLLATKVRSGVWAQEK